MTSIHPKSGGRRFIRKAADGDLLNAVVQEKKRFGPSHDTPMNTQRPPPPPQSAMGLREGRSSPSGSSSALRSPATTAGMGSMWASSPVPVGVERENRLDKVATMGLKAMELEILHPGRIEIPRPASESLEIPWSDHCGRRCTFTVGKPVDEEW
ncbi:hypothetical protein C0991_010101 [Blastosporella zonata]|nr:hypothetical protein C0991_010101 [Blastosporella zonata]